MTCPFRRLTHCVKESVQNLLRCSPKWDCYSESVVPRGSGFGIRRGRGWSLADRPAGPRWEPTENPYLEPASQRRGPSTSSQDWARKSVLSQSGALSSISLLSCEVRDLQASQKSLLKGTKVLIILLLMWLLSILPENGTLSFKVTAIFSNMKLWK